MRCDTDFREETEWTKPLTAPSTQVNPAGTTVCNIVIAQRVPSVTGTPQGLFSCVQSFTVFTENVMNRFLHLVNEINENNQFFDQQLSLY